MSIWTYSNSGVGSIIEIHRLLLKSDPTESDLLDYSSIGKIYHERQAER